MPTHPRPLSPHLSVYRFTLTMAMSIVHRITGAALYAGTLLLVAWLAAAAWGGAPFEAVQGLFGGWPGRIVLFGYSWALLHHMFGGFRYFVWDRGRGMEAGAREWLSRINLIASLVLTLVAWTVFVWR